MPQRRTRFSICVASSLLLSALLGLPVACRSKPQQSQDRTKTSTSRDAAPWFEEVAAKSGIAFSYERGPLRFLFPEIIGGGAALFDYDNDGDLDLYCVQAGDLLAPRSKRPTNRLFRNRGDGTFEDVTETAGVGDQGYGMGCACGDYDGDGDIDLYVTNYGPNVLYRNNGDGSFTDVSKAVGVDDSAWGSSAGFFDADNDGDLDLFIVNYISWARENELECNRAGGQRDYCNPENYNAAAVDVFYRNNGDGTFAESTKQAGFGSAFGNGLGVAFGDFNNDGNTDVYVANDGNPNQLWMNDGNGRFENDALLAGCAVNSHGTAEAGMGVATVDIDADGDLDLFMTHLKNETNTLYMNTAGAFDDRTARFGLASPSVRYTAFGMGFADFNHDGFLDLFIANGKVTLDGVTDPTSMSDPYVDPNLLMRGRADGAFEEVLPIGGTLTPVIGTSRAAAFGDIDNDGDVDIVVVESGGPLRLLRNTAENRKGHWATFTVRDENGRDAIGARLLIRAGDRKFARSIQPAYSYCASNDPRIHVGLGDHDRIDAVEIRWSDEATQTRGPFDVDMHHVLRRAAADSD